MTMPAAVTMPVDEETLASLVDAARLSTSQLENVAQSILGASITSISNASTPAEQARDMVTYARQYGLLRQVAAAIIYTGADRAGLQNLILGDEMVNQTEDQHSISVNALDIVKLDNRVGRLEDKYDALAQQVASFLHRTPLNWNIVAWGVAVAIIAGSLMWIMATVK